MPAAKRISPRTRSVQARSSSGIRSRSTGSRPSARNAAFCSSVRYAVVVVVAELGVLAGGAAAGVDLLVGGERLVGVAGGQQLGGDVAVDLVPLATAGRARAGRRPRGPRPSRARASAGSRAGAGRTPRSRARRRCPRCGRRSVPPVCRACAQLNSAVRIRPTCTMPVGDGQNRVRTSLTGRRRRVGDGVGGGDGVGQRAQALDRARRPAGRARSARPRTACR